MVSWRVLFAIFVFFLFVLHCHAFSLLNEWRMVQVGWLVGWLDVTGFETEKRSVQGCFIAVLDLFPCCLYTL